MNSIFKAFWKLSQLDRVVVTDKTKRLLGAFSPLSAVLALPTRVPMASLRVPRQPRPEP